MHGQGPAEVGGAPAHVDIATRDTQFEPHNGPQFLAGVIAAGPRGITEFVQPEKVYRLRDVGFWQILL
jgi:hypothetical protein